MMNVFVIVGIVVMLGLLVWAFSDYKDDEEFELEALNDENADEDELNAILEAEADLDATEADLDRRAEDAALLAAALEESGDIVDTDGTMPVMDVTDVEMGEVTEEGAPVVAESNDAIASEVANAANVNANGAASPTVSADK